uniref:Uncharacterized protein n=1 Tax=Fagus sylvatica TaxID=28930 RepID=A0A2N9HI40_FAGSY
MRRVIIFLHLVLSFFFVFGFVGVPIVHQVLEQIRGCEARGVVARELRFGSRSRSRRLRIGQVDAESSGVGGVVEVE